MCSMNRDGMADNPSPSRRPWPFLLACALAFAVLWGSYSHYFNNSFHFDDSHVIETNAYIRSLKNIGKFFTDAGTLSSLPANSNYRPLVTLSLAVDYWLGGGLVSRQFHITQFSLLVFMGILLFFLYKHVIDWAGLQWWNRYLALFATLLYCVHTVNTETLNIISTRSEFIATGGILGAFLIYIHAPRWRRLYLYLIPMAIGALAKPPAVMFAPLLFVYVFLFEEDADWGRLFQTLRKTLPTFVVGLALFVFVNKMDHPEAVYSTYNRWGYFLTQPFIWLHYFRLFFIPVGLTADTDWTLLEHWYDTRLFAGVFFALMMLWLTWRFSRRPQSRPTAFGLAWFALALLPASSFFPLSEVSNEHRAFFPYIGLALAVVFRISEVLKDLCAWRPRRSRLIIATAFSAALLALGGFAVGTYERNKVWKTEETLWYDVTLKSPTNGRALMNYGLSQMSQGKYPRAKEYFERALVYNPYYPTLETNLAIVNSAMGDAKTAEAHFQRALSLQPRFAEGHYFYARWLNQQKRVDEAIAHLETALAISPGHGPSRELLMSLYSAQGRQDQLLKLVQDTLAVWPDDPTANNYARRLGIKK